MKFGLAKFSLLVLAVTAALVGAKWALHGTDAPTQAAALPLRGPASTDLLVQNLQARIIGGREDARGYALLGNAYLQKARETSDPAYYSKAEAALQKALALDPQNFEATLGAVSLALSRHGFADGLELATRASEINPYSSQAYGLKGDALIGLGRYAEAWEAFQKSVDLRPDIASLSRAAYARELTGDVPGAMEAMERALAAGGPNAENTAWVLVQVGHLYFNSGDLDGAERAYTQALALYPSYIHAQAALAKVQAARGEYEYAIALYRQVVERVPYPEYVIALGDALQTTGRGGEASKAYALVRVQQQLYRANGVNTDLEMALFDADHGFDLEGALAHAQQEYQRRPNIVAADVMAWTLYKAGRFQEAAGYSREALRLGTRDALLLFHAGMIARANQDVGAARRYLGQALSINPHFSVLYQGEARAAYKALAAQKDQP